jgi:hypothetical protein
MPGRSEPRTLRLPVRALESHRAKLCRVLGARLSSRGGEAIQLKQYPGGASIDFYIQASGSTRKVTTDRQGEEAAGLLSSRGAGDLLCSFGEGWTAATQTTVELRAVTLRFFLQPPGHPEGSARQLFRLEWENDFQAPGAAYPHWQFDRWLTASDSRTVDELRALFEGQPEPPVRDFGEVVAPAAMGRPNLSWFTKLHFPVIAPWFRDRISDLALEEQPHRHRLIKEEDILAWIDSSLLYIRDQFARYG